MNGGKNRMCEENAPEGYFYNHNEGAYQVIACKPLGEINPEPGHGGDTETVVGEDIETTIADVMANTD